MGEMGWRVSAGWANLPELRQCGAYKPQMSRVRELQKDEDAKVSFKKTQQKRRKRS